MQVIFLLVPFLRFFRALQALRFVRIARLARYGSTLSAGVRGSRSAGRLLTGRIGWLTAITAVVILASSQLIYATGDHDCYAESLYGPTSAQASQQLFPAANLPCVGVCPPPRSSHWRELP